jgi:hypothetical protein
MERPAMHDYGPQQVDLYVRGQIPSELAGSLIVSTSRRNKDRHVFSRWHDSQTDLMKIDLCPGKPGQARVHILPVDPSGASITGFQRNEYDRAAFGKDTAYGYVTQPNHGLNVSNGTLWATNLLFGAPLEVDIETWQPRRVLRYVMPDAVAPRVSSTSHYAWSLDRRYAYFHQSLLERETAEHPVRSSDVCLIELDSYRNTERIWRLCPPPEDNIPEAINFHSAFYFEEHGEKFVGLLRTGAVVEYLGEHRDGMEHAVAEMPVSTIWIVRIDYSAAELQAELLPGVKELDGLALSHLDVDNSSGNGFVLYANFKESDVAEETHGVNVYGDPPDAVMEHYAGMIVEGINFGQVMRYEQRDGLRDLKVFKRDYDSHHTSLGHTWLPINIELDSSREFLFCSFAGFHPRLLPKHIVDTYAQKAVDPNRIRYVPPLVMRLDAKSLTPTYSKRRDYLSYAEPIAMCVVGNGDEGWLCTFSPEVGLRIYRAGDLTRMVAHAVSAQLHHWEDTHFRPDPAHMVFVPR